VRGVHHEHVHAGLDQRHGPRVGLLADADGGPGAGAALTAAKQTPGAELISYPSHHFAVFSPEFLGVHCDDAIDFLRRRVGLRTEPGVDEIG